MVSPHDTLIAILKILETVTNICDGFSFQYIYRWWIQQLKLLKKNFTNTFFWESAEIFKTWVFLNILWKMHEVIWHSISNDKGNQERVNIEIQEIHISSETSTVNSLFFQILESSNESSLQLKLVSYFSSLWNTVSGSTVFLLFFIWRISSNDVKQQIYLIDQEGSVRLSLIHVHFR